MLLATEWVYHLLDLNRNGNRPYWLKMFAGMLLLDLAIYPQHVMFHATPVFWRLHMMHHADADFDVTTGVRFHPVGILLSMAIKLANVAVIGPPPLAALPFEIFFNVTSMFNYGDVRRPSVGCRSDFRINGKKEDEECLFLLSSPRNS